MWERRSAGPSRSIADLPDRAIDAMMAIMRYPKGHKAAVKERIIRAASRSLRRHGLLRVSIPALMKRAGLTHGGFYTHFKNRDELVAAAVASAAAETAAGVFAEEFGLEETLERYLSKSHLEQPEKGCVLAALGADGIRQRPRVRAAFAEIARGFLYLTQRKLPQRGRAGTLSDEALACAATMVGAVVLGRLVDDAALSERILSAARATLSD
jgi:TetR/AcrR family transcriptional repressor of nem operon